MTDSYANAETILRIFTAVEQRDEKRMVELCLPDVEFHWPGSLPYGGQFRGMQREGPSWGKTWIPLQPTETERKMNPRIVAASENEIVVLWTQRGMSSLGNRFEGEVLGLYRLREGRLAQAQMFYFDTAAVVAFLERASSDPASNAVDREISGIMVSGSIAK
jgi:ketosteroid isomerase-like protein